MDRPAACLLLPLALSCGACGGDDSPAGGEGGAGTSGPTYYEDVAPIVYDNCLPCHTEAGIAPFALTTYEQTRARAPSIVAATAARIMPPWPADNSGSCNTFRDARWLSQEQIDTLAAWDDARWPAGDPAKGPALPAPQQGLAEVSTTLDIGAVYTPSDGVDDDYRCFVVDPQLTSDQFLTAYEVKPGEPRVVHHVILYSLDGAEAEQQAESLDAGEPGPGYTCFGSSGVGASSFVAGWAPGTATTFYPEGTGVQLHAGRKLVMQIHYNLEAGALPDRTTMDLTLRDSVPSPATITLFANFNLLLPPGQSDIVQEGSFANPAPVPVKLWGHFPHMHELGTSLEVTADRGAEELCLVDVPVWDFHWQQMYFYEEPLVMEPDDLLRIRCHYDTTESTTTVTWGDGTKDEMCLDFLYTTL